MELSWKERILYFLFPPKCAGCGELLDLRAEDRSGLVFCPVCMRKWRRAKLEPCPCCGGFISDCAYLPARFPKSACTALLKLTFDKPDADGYVPNRLVYRLKHADQSRFFDFAAVELREKLVAYLHKNKISVEDLCFAWIPRRPAAIARDGCDHAAEITRRLAGMLGVPARPQLILRHSGKEEKGLNSRERSVNMKKTLYLRHDAAEVIKGKTVVVVDDIFTTGAGMAVAGTLLHGAGADAVICLVVSKTV